MSSLLPRIYVFHRCSCSDIVKGACAQPDAGGSFKHPRACYNCLLSFSFPTALSWELPCLITETLQTPSVLTFPSLSLDFSSSRAKGMVRRGSACSQECLGANCSSGLSPSLSLSLPRGPTVSHAAHSLMLSGGPALTCAKLGASHCPSETHPSTEMPPLCWWEQQGSQPCPTKILWMHWPSFCAQLEFCLSLGGIPPEFGWLRDGSKHYQGQEIPVQERICRVWVYLLHSSGQILVSLCHQQCLGQSSTSPQPEQRLIRGCTSPWAAVSSLSGLRFLPLNGYGRISPTSLTWSFLNKGHVLGASRVDFRQLRPHGSCHTAPPAWLALVASATWELLEEKSVLASCDTGVENLSGLWVRCSSEVLVELLNNGRVWGALAKWEIIRSTLYYIKAEVA